MVRGLSARARRGNRCGGRLSGGQFPGESPGSPEAIRHRAFSMKRSIFGLVMLFLASAATCSVGFATDTVNQDAIVRVDPYGDGSMKVIFHLSASRWATWRQQYGDHPDVLWRDLKQKFAKAALDKFDLQRNDVDRTATANIEARALTSVRGDGSRGIDMMKEFRLVSNTPLEWVFEATSQASPDAPILAQTFRVFLPSGAINAHIDSPGTSSQQLVYEMPEISGNNALLLWAGILAMGAGILLGILGLVSALAGSKRPPPLPPTLARQG